MEKVRFEWDEGKDKDNQRKHGVSFGLAQRSFLDSHRIIAEDVSHSTVRIDSSVWAESTTVSLLFDSHTGGMSSASMVLGIGEKGERFMKSRIKYVDEPMGKLKVIRDFLPPPEELALKENKVKITISLSRSSIDFFKKEAKRNRTSYQKMIRRVIDSYASHYQ